MARITEEKGVLVIKDKHSRATFTPNPDPNGFIAQLEEGLRRLKWYGKEDLQKRYLNLKITSKEQQDKVNAIVNLFDDTEFIIELLEIHLGTY